MAPRRKSEPNGSSAKPAKRVRVTSAEPAPSKAVVKKPSKSALKAKAIEEDEVNVAADQALKVFDDEDEEELDSSDEELEVARAANRPQPEEIQATNLPAIARDDALVKRKLDRAKKDKAAKPGVIYLGRIPKGFYEDQMRAYFEQFGTVTRLRMSRNKKTGAPKHYAFIEFESASVAQVAAETMHNYLLLGHILQCKVIPPEYVHSKLWLGASRKNKIVDPTALAHREAKQFNAPKSEEQQKRVSSRLISRENKKRKRFEELGLDYDFTGYSQSVSDANTARQIAAANAIEAKTANSDDVAINDAAKEAKKRKQPKRARKSV